MKNLKFPVLLFVAIATFFISCEEKTDLDLENENLTTIEKLRFEAKESNVTLEENDSYIEMKGDGDAIKEMKEIFINKYNFKLIDNKDFPEFNIKSEGLALRSATEPCDMWTYESNGSTIYFIECCRGGKCYYYTFIN